jgi:hypothetical protein
MGHLVTCFLAFLIERTLEIKLKKANLISAPEQVREALDSLQVSTLEIGDPSISLSISPLRQVRWLRISSKIQSINSLIQYIKQA